MPISVTPNAPTGLGATRSRKPSIPSPFWALVSFAIPVAVAPVVVVDDEAEGVFES